MRLNSAATYIVFLGLLSGCAAQLKPASSVEIDEAQERLVSGDWLEAAQRFDGLADKYKRVDFFLAAAQAYCRLGKNKACEARLAAAARLAPTDNRVLIAVARVIKAGASKGKTITSPENLNAASFWSHRAREKVQESNILTALSDLEVATGIDRKRLQDWVLLGHLARKLSRNKLASQAHYEAYTLLEQEPFRSHPKATALQQKMLTSVLALTALTSEHELAATVLEMKLGDWPGRLVRRFVHSMLLPTRAEVAWRVYKRLLKTRAEESDLLIGLASAYAVTGDNERLVESYRPIAKHYETPEKLLLEAVRAAFITENTDAAISFLGQRRTLRRQPREALIMLAQGLLDARQYARARSELLIYASLYSENVAYRYLQAIAHERTGDWKGFEQLVRGVIQDSPNHARALNYYGYSLAQRGERLKQAQSYVERALRVVPTSGPYLDSLGWIYYRQGRYADALVLIQRAVMQLPKEPEVQLHLACILNKLNKYTVAQSVYKQALKLARDDDDRLEYEREWELSKVK